MATTENPPSYQSVVSGLEQKLRTAPTDLGHVTNVLNSLSENEKQVLTSNTETKAISPATVTDEQHAAVAQGMVDAMKSNLGSAFIKTAATNARNAVKAIDAMFTHVLSELSSIDSKYSTLTPKEGPFAKRLDAIRMEYQSIVDDSRTLAIKIAQYGKQFGSMIVPFSQEKDIPLEERRQKVQEFITRATQFETDSGVINTRFQNVKAAMTTFTGTFSNWAQERENAIGSEIADLQNQISDLNDEINAKTIAMIALGAVAGASLPITGVIAACCGPAAPVVMLVGCLVAFATAGTAIGLCFKISSLKDQRAQKQRDIDKLNIEKKGIQDTRAKLNSLKDEQLATFKDNVDVLATFWQCAKGDAQKVLEALQSADSYAKYPKYLMIQLNEANSIYEILAQYLEEYAKGVDMTAK